MGQLNKLPHLPLHALGDHFQSAVRRQCRTFHPRVEVAAVVSCEVNAVIRLDELPVGAAVVAIICGKIGDMKLEGLSFVLRLDCLSCVLVY